MQYFLSFVGFVAVSYGAGLTYMFISDARRTALQNRMNAEYRWHPYRRGLDLMRRRPVENGPWIFRGMTDSEFREYLTDRW